MHQWTSSQSERTQKSVNERACTISTICMRTFSATPTPRRTSHVSVQMERRMREEKGPGHALSERKRVREYLVYLIVVAFNTYNIMSILESFVRPLVL